MSESSSKTTTSSSSSSPPTALRHSEDGPTIAAHSLQNPWLEIGLEDYEGHMACVGQAEMLSDFFGELLSRLMPRAVAVLGCAGGNGFDRISPSVTQRVVGVDVNPLYVEALSRRFTGTFAGLELHTGSIEAPDFSIGGSPVDLVFAALVFEYVLDLGTALSFVRRACKPGSVFAVVLQLPSATVDAVSPSPFYASLRKLAPAMRLVSPDEFSQQAASAGFSPLSSRHVTLQSGKAFAFLELQL